MASNLTFNKGQRVQKVLASVTLATVCILLAAGVFIGLAAASQPLRLLDFHIPVISHLSDQSLPMVKPSKGKFLVASRQLLDPNFSKTVILLIEYHRQGAMGVIINRPTELKLSKVLPDVDGLQQRPDTIYLGGPVAKNQLLLLIRTASPPEGSHHVFNDIYVSSSQTVIQRMLEDPNSGDRFRVYAGYAGWAPGQLDHEISRGGWHVLQGDVETVFDKSAPEIWPALIHRSSARWVRVLVQ